MVEDNDGNLWYCTVDGLSRINIYTEVYKKYRHDPADTNSISHDFILCVFKDHTGVLWIGTGNEGLNRYYPETDHFRSFKPDPGITGYSNNIRDIYEDERGILWIATSQGLFKFDRQTEDFTKIKLSPYLKDNIGLMMIHMITQDHDGTLLLGTEYGFLQYNTVKDELDLSYLYFNKDARLGYIDLVVDPEDPNRYFWFLFHGLFNYDKLTGITTQVTDHDPKNPFDIHGTSLVSIDFDKTGVMWIPGNWGLNISVPELDQMNESLGFKEKYGNATVFLRDRDNHLWIATDKKPLLLFDEEFKLLRVFEQRDFQVEPGETKFWSSPRCIFEDSNQNIWIADGRNGVYCLKHGSVDFIHCKLTEYKTLKPEFIYDIYEDSQGDIWIGTSRGLFVRRNADPSVRDFVGINTGNFLDSGEVMKLYEDHLGYLWAGTNFKGLFCRPPEKRNTNDFINYAPDAGNELSISNEFVWSIYEDRRGDLWIGTEKGLNRFIREENAFERFISEEDPAETNIRDLTGDDKGFLWMVTEKGLVKFKPGMLKKGCSYPFFIKKVIPFEDICNWNLDKTSDGRIYIGGKQGSDVGYYSFFPDSLIENPLIPPVFITDFRVHNEKFHLDSSITAKKQITLRYNQNFFSFEFAALDYTNMSNQQYAYFLEGYDNDWIYSGVRRTAYYTGVPPGDYHFRVKGSNNDGYWNEDGAAMHITILPPPWKTWWAYTLYGLCLLGLIIAWREYDLRRLRLKHALDLKQVEAQKLKELDSMKSRFFANISHEFRTPLTLILGPMQNLFQKVSDETGKQDLNIMQRSALRLQRLINQLLELSRLESGKMELHLNEENIVALVKNYAQQFESLARHKGITLEFKAENDEIPALVDREKIEIILYNLLGNAFKFTAEGGRIEVTVSGQRSAVSGQTKIADRRLPTADLPEQCVVITVSDTGCGIPPDKLNRIFDRFYQVDDSYTKDDEGTGIGLALTKELVELHGGTICVESVVNQGSTFRVYFPFLKGERREERGERRDRGVERGLEKGIETSNIEHRQLTIDNQEPATRNAEPETLNAERETQNAEPLLLIVEDNADLRLYLRGILGQDYQVLEAGSGWQGLSKALEHIPDLVLTDVMMPEMDGYELTRHLKSDEKTSHIPVILLTARAGMESRIEGLETGADDFITKPFDTDELLVRIKNLILQRKILQGRFLKNAEIIGLNRLMGLPDNGIPSVDQQFLRKAIRMVEQHLNDDKFTVEQFTEAMAVSQMQLYRKLKALVNLSTSEFIRFVRLNNAAMLLRQQAGNIAEIAYAVGFNNPSYFAECFKKQFGQTPSEFADLKKSKSQADHTL